MNPLALKMLRSVSLFCPSLDDAHRFYTEAWGLEVVHHDEQRLSLRGTGPEHHIVDFVAADHTGLNHLAFAVATPREVDAAAERVRSLGVTVEDEPARLDLPGGGYGFTFCDPEGRCILLSSLVAAVAPANRSEPRPVELSHVVLNTVDLETAVEFWTDVVGLRISDYSEDQMVFLRCNPKHHSIAFNRAEWTSVNHIAYELPSLDAYFQAIGRLAHHGDRPLWGPGRHGPGGNPFAYCADPVGYVPEITTGLDQVDEATWVPRVWQRVPGQSDLWGTAGPPSVDARSRMAGSPDPSSPSGGKP